MNECFGRLERFNFFLLLLAQLATESEVVTEDVQLDFFQNDLRVSKYAVASEVVDVAIKSTGDSSITFSFVWLLLSVKFQM